MFHGSVDIANGLAVWLFTPGQNTDLDWAAYCNAMGEVTRVLKGHPAPFVVQVIDPLSSDPTAKHRREIAEVSMVVPSGSSIAIVSRSRIVRGVITAVSWIRPHAYTLHVVSTERDAFVLADVDSPGRGAHARRLLERLRHAKDP